MKIDGTKIIYKLNETTMAREIDWEATLAAHAKRYSERYAKVRAGFVETVQEHLANAGQWDPIFEEYLTAFWGKYPTTRVSRSAVVSMTLTPMLADGKFEMKDHGAMTKLLEAFVDSNVAVVGTEDAADSMMLRDNDKGRNAQLYLAPSRRPKAG